MHGRDLQTAPMPHAVILGGTGQIGLALATRLSQTGWSVTLASRSATAAQGFSHTPFDRTSPNALQRAIGTGCNLLIDCIAFTAADAQSLLSVQCSIEHIIAISSASVYADEKGRTLDTAQSLGVPIYPIPIDETHPTIPPGPATYSTNKAAMEQTLLQNATAPVTILRPCAIHGPNSKHAREWWFVKRLLDNRPRIPLVDMGQNRFQTTSTQAICDAVLSALALTTPPILNVADADAPSVYEIGQTILSHLSGSCELVPIETDHPTLGRTPWSLKHPIVCASVLPGKTPYTASIGPALDWLKTLPRDNWQPHIPQLAAYPRDHFDYQTEDNIPF